MSPDVECLQNSKTFYRRLMLLLLLLAIPGTGEANNGIETDATYIIQAQDTITVNP